MATCNHSPFYISNKNRVFQPEEAFNCEDSKRKQNSAIPLAPIKVNIKKFPGDFFSKMSSKPPMPPRLLKLPKERAQTDRKYKKLNDYLENDKELLPEAQVTSFFKMAEHLSTTTDISPAKTDKYYSETKLNKDENYYQIQNNVEDRDIATSIQLSNQIDQDSFRNDLLCTFAKRANLGESVKTPTKQVKIERQENLSTTKGKSVQLIKMKKKNGIDEKIPKIERKGRRGSFEEIHILNEQEGRTARKSSSRNNEKRSIQEIFLPKINRAH